LDGDCEIGTKEDADNFSSESQDERGLMKKSVMGAALVCWDWALFPVPMRKTSTTMPERSEWAYDGTQ
jgi:hypothetical protein